MRNVLFGTYFEPNPGASGILSIDGGSLSKRGTVNPSLAVTMRYGDLERPLNFDLRADGSDRFEIEILAASPTTTWGEGSVTVQLRPDNDGQLGAPFAGGSAILHGPGLLVLPFANLGSRLAEFEHDVAFMTFQVSGSMDEVVVGEIRTAATPTPAEAASWGRIKSAYRR